ncbi:MAG TPA: mechanosensitive ion channel family protein [Acidobacteriota bacterium]|jgi:small conductance mechanosensitive channel|nr:mechanosensitive ion channel family protein [Acidobacteriota bacterium]HNT17404.1 mechanosensitive ion channel family protein [Acidobacteriota bacterium]HPA27561.1 mechanosensitive ion channel family protein [Acidobacteriota bacterium]HQO18797.1 mechanosensitive ion channel family protein [Acidobacteriota bacterium]HQQ46686.1 mechanosensitive ion channel family protein [Acidobacteriota bacterium]
MILNVFSDFIVRMDEIFPHFLRRTLIAASYIVVAYFLAHLWRRMVVKGAVAVLEREGEKNEDLRGRVDTISVILKRTGYVVIYITAFLMVLGEMGVAIGPLLTGLGIAGVAVGFGAQYLVKDMISGFFIVSEDQYRVGEFIKIDSFEGTVECISLRTTKIRAFGGQIHIIPNGEIRALTNLSRDFIRAIVDVDLPYGLEPETAFSALARAAENLARDEEFSKDLLENPEVQGITLFGQSALRYRILAKVRPSRGRMLTENRMRSEVVSVLKGLGIEIPFQKMEVRLEK